MKDSRAILLVNISVLLFGAAGLFAKWISLPAVAMTFGRVLFSSAALLLFCLVRKEPLKVQNGKVLLRLAAAGVILAIHWIAFFLSIKLSTVATGMITFSTFPLFVTFLEPVFLKERLLTRDVVAAVMIMVGVVITVPRFSIENSVFLGILAGMLSSLSYAALALMNRHFAKSQPSAMTAFYEQSFAAGALAPCMLFIRVRPSAADIGLLALLGVVMTALAHTLFISTLKRLTARAAGVISSVEVVYGIILASVLLREIPTYREIAGGLVIVGTVVANRLQTRRPQTKT
jgi:drug/metabolite transporter (DMT)-like permease